MEEGLNPRSTCRTVMESSEPEVERHIDNSPAESSHSKTLTHDREKVGSDALLALQKNDCLKSNSVLTNVGPLNRCSTENSTTPEDIEDTGGMMSMDLMQKQFSSMMKKVQQKQAKSEKVLHEEARVKQEFAERILKKDLEIKRLKSCVEYFKRKLGPRLKQEKLTSETSPEKHVEVYKDTGNVFAERTSEMDAGCVGQRTKMPLCNKHHVLLERLPQDNTAFIGKACDSFENNSENLNNGRIESEDVCSCERKFRNGNSHETRISQDLQIEKQTNESLRSRIAALEAKLKLTENCQSKTLKNLKTEVIVLRQQMVVAVEDFERERTERESAVSSRSKLQEKCAKLNSKIKALEYQLMLSRESLEEKSSSNSQLQQHIRRLSTELKAKDGKIALLSEQLMFSPAGLPSHGGRPQPPDVARQLLQNNCVVAASPFETESGSHWSCDGCTFLNSATRTVCDLCGNVRKFGDMATAHVAGRSTNQHCIVQHSNDRLCRLISRGLSTDGS